ncbi:hypothetical protein MTP99_003165 [Tenebrio molitor]|nr:hypothetical protein MTP99_003165 [Tenebrio molitor]
MAAASITATGVNSLCARLTGGRFVAAVSTILDSLDDIYCLQESHPQERAHLLALLEDTHLHVLLELYDRIASKVVTPVRAPPSDAVQRARDAADALRELEHRRDTDHRDLQELRDLLCRPHFKLQEKDTDVLAIRPGRLGRIGVGGGWSFTAAITPSCDASLNRRRLSDKSETGIIRMGYGVSTTIIASDDEWMMCETHRDL